MPDPAKLGVVNTSPVWIIVREQECPEPRTRAPRDQSTDHDKLLPVLALDLDPQAAIAGE